MRARQYAATIFLESWGKAGFGFHPMYNLECFAAKFGGVGQVFSVGVVARGSQGLWNVYDGGMLRDAPPQVVVEQGVVGKVEQASLFQHGAAHKDSRLADDAEGH